MNSKLSGRMPYVRATWVAALLVGLAFDAAGQSPAINQFIDDTQVQDVWLDLPASDWATLLQNYESDTYYQATFTWNGVQEVIGIRQHGGGSRSPIKPNLDLNFAHYTKTQTFLGQGFLILKANNEDPSDLHEWIAMKLFRQMGMPAPRESFARLHINEQYFGFYLIVEHEDTEFAQRNFGESGGYLYEWENQGDNYDFGNLGTNPNLYANYLDLKTNQATSDLQTFTNLVQVINQPSNSSNPGQFISALSAYLDPKYFLTYAATENVLAEEDGLVGGLEGMNNFDLYQFQGTTLYTIIPWDKDLTFSAAERSIFDGSVVGATACSSCPPGLINVLAAELMSMPAYQNFYLEQLTRAAALMGATGGWADSEVTREYGVIDADASNDPYKQCMENGQTYTCGEADFQAGVSYMHSFLAVRASLVTSQIAAAGYQAPTGDPAVTSVLVTGTGGAADVVPGSIMNVNGSNFGPANQATSNPLPFIDGTSYVTIEGVRAPLFMTSSTSIEVQVPWDIPLAPASVVVSVAGVMSNSFLLPVVPAAPAILAVTHSNGSPVNGSSPAIAGETIVVYLTGLGAVNTDQQTGSAALAGVLVSTSVTPQVSAGNAPLAVLFSGLTPGLVGVYQVNATLPSPLSQTGSVPLDVSSGGMVVSAQIQLQ